MTFNNANPANNQKIRNGPSDIRNNFQAIENGDVSFAPATINFTDTGGPAATIATVGRIYGRINTGLRIELNYINNNGDDLQLTQDGKLGSEATDIYANSISFDGGTFTNNQNGMCTAWAYVDSTGTIQDSYGFASWVKNSTGKYTGTFTGGQVTNSNYAVIGMAFTTSGGGNNNDISLDANENKDTSTFTVRIRSNSGDSSGNRNFMIAVFGGR